MALTNLQKFRQLKINDNYKGFSQTFLGDGEANTFDLNQYPVRVSAYTAYIDGVAQHETADYTLSPDDGRLTFVNSPANNAQIRFVGQYSTFSDTELAEIMSPIATGATDASLNSLDTPLLQCVETLISDAWRRHSWGAAGANVSEGQLFTNLIQWRKMLLDKASTELGPTTDGGLEGWSENQKDYGSEYEG